MPVVASATLEVTPVLSGAQQSLTEQLTGVSAQAGEKAGAESGGKFASSMAKKIAVGSAAVAGAVTAVGAALVSTASKTAAYGDQIDKASQKLGVSSTFYQEWEAVLQRSGTSMDKMSGTFKTLAKASQDASADQQAAFEKLGMSMEDVSKMSPEELFQKTIAGLQNMENGTERTALATTLLGKGAMEMGALLNTSAEDTQAMIDKVHDLGGVMSEDAVKSSAQFQDSLLDMQTAFSGVKNGIGAQLLPALSGLMDKVSEFVSTADLSPVTDTLGKAVSALGDFIAGLDIEAVGSTFMTVVSGIGAAVELAWSVIETVFGALKDGFSTVSAALGETNTDWSDVWAGISAVITEVAGIISDVIGIISSVIANLIVEAQTQGTLFNAIWESIQIAIQAAGEVIHGVVDFISALLAGDWQQAWTSAQGIVDDFVGGIVTGISNLASAAVDAIVGLGQSILDGFKSFFGIASPSTVMEEQGNFLIEGLVNALTALPEAIGGILAGALETVVTWGADLVSKGVDAAQNFLGGVSKKWEGLKTKTAETFENVKTKVGTTLTNAKNTAVKTATDLKDKAVEKWNNLKDKTKETYDNVKDKITTTITNAKDTAVQKVTDLKDKAVEKWNDLKTKTAETYTNVKDKINTSMTDAKDKTVQAATLLKDKAVEKWTDLASRTKETYENIKSDISDKITSAKDTASTVVENLRSTVSGKWGDLSKSASEKWKDIKGFVTDNMSASEGNATSSAGTLFKNVSGKFLDAAKSANTNFADMQKNISDKMKDAVKNAGTAAKDIYDKITNKFRDAKSKTADIFGDIYSKIKNKMGDAKDAVSNAVQKIKDKMHFHWSLPHLKLPHVHISGHFSLNPPSVPHFSIDWYKKAYDNPFLFTSPTVISAMGFGDGNGSEIVYGHENLMKDIREATNGGSKETAEILSILKEYLPVMAEMKVILDSGALVGAITPQVDKELGKIYASKVRGY